MPIARTLLAAAMLLSALLAPPAADADVYAVHACKTPSGGGTTTEGWGATTLDWSVNSRSDGCPAGPFELEMKAGVAHRATDFIRMSFWAPADTQIAGYSVWRSVELPTLYDYALRVHRAVAFTPMESCSGCRRGSVSQPLADANLVRASGLQGVDMLDFMLACGRPDDAADACPVGSSPARLQFHRVDLELRDDLAPVITVPPNGPLVDTSRALSGVQSVSLGASDRGGGVYQVAFEVDGNVVDRVVLDDNGGLCRPPFTARMPCKPVATGTLSFDTSQLRDGEHSLRLLVSDATGTNVAPWGPVRIRTANSACSPAPRVRSLRLTAGFERRRGARSRSRARSVVTRYGRRLRVRGVLRRPDGAPVAHAKVCAVSRDDRAGAPLRSGRSVTTSRRGRFSYVLRRGASRRVFFVTRVPGGAVRASVMVRVRAPVRMRPSRRELRNGQTLTLRGRLRGRPFPRPGVIVAIQAKRSSGWQSFGNARTDRHGRFRLRYQFVRTSGVQRYRFRASVPKQPTYPYAAGASRPVVVRVVG